MHGYNHEDYIGMLNAVTKHAECETDLREWNKFCEINREVKIHVNLEPQLKRAH